MSFLRSPAAGLRCAVPASDSVLPWRGGAAPNEISPEISWSLKEPYLNKSADENECGVGLLGNNRSVSSHIFGYKQDANACRITPDDSHHTYYGETGIVPSVCKWSQVKKGLCHLTRKQRRKTPLKPTTDSWTKQWKPKVHEVTAVELVLLSYHLSFISPVVMGMHLLDFCLSSSRMSRRCWFKSFKHSKKRKWNSRHSMFDLLNALWFL